MNPTSRSDYGACLEVLLSAIYHRVIGSGDTVIDGGANGGLHTIPLGWIVAPTGKVYAYEAQHVGMAPLQRWVDFAGLSEICLLRNVAIGAYNGETTFYYNNVNDPHSSARRMNDNLSEWVETRVPIVRIDDDNIVGRCSFIKLDIEGGERDALMGAENLISRDTPVIAFENGLAWTARRFGYDVFEFLEFFHARDYEVYDFMGTRVDSANLVSGALVGEFVAFHKGDEKKQTILETIREFNLNFFNVSPAEDWGKVIERVQRPFLSGFWKSDTI